ncbi:MAG TPA: transposase [Bacteroidales bacterium]
MPEAGYKIRNQQGLYFITFAVVEWVDVFTRQQYRDIVLDSLNFCIKQKGLRLFAWVIMSNHVHFIASANEENKLSDILRDFKKFTAVKILEAIRNNPQESRKEWMLAIFRLKGKENARNTTNQFWRQENHPKELTDNMMIEQKLDYLHNNPVAAGLVENAEDYLYSSARNYSGMKGLIKIEEL